VPLTAAFVAWSCRFEKVAEPEPSAFTVTDNVLDVGVKATNYTFTVADAGTKVFTALASR
jgi:hypothetical protein